MALVRALENRRKMEEREKKRLEVRAERIATKEKRAEQRKMEMELIEQIRKPVEDMELTGTSQGIFNGMCGGICAAPQFIIVRFQITDHCQS